MRNLLLGAVAAGLLAVSGANATDRTAKSINGSGLTSINKIIDSNIDSGMMFKLPIKGDKNVYIPIVMPMILAEGAGLWIYPGGGIGGLYPDTQEGDSACHLKEAYRLSYGAGLGIYGNRLFYSSADNTG